MIVSSLQWSARPDFYTIVHVGEQGDSLPLPCTHGRERGRGFDFASDAIRDIRPCPPACSQECWMRANAARGDERRTRTRNRLRLSSTIFGPGRGSRDHLSKLLEHP